MRAHHVLDMAVGTPRLLLCQGVIATGRLVLGLAVVAS